MGKILKYGEEELVENLMVRNQQAYNYLYDNYSGALFVVIRKIVSDDETACDLLQDVFIAIWMKMESYDPVKGKLFTWIYNIARNASIDAIRKKGFKNRSNTQPLWNNMNLFFYSEKPCFDSICIKKYLNILQEKHRTLIELCYFEGYTHQQIAKIKCLPLGTVKTHIRTALFQLREYWKTDDEMLKVYS